MPFRLPNPFILPILLTLGVRLTLSPAHAAPEAAAKAPVSIAGKALAQCLPELGRNHGVSLAPAPELAAQRVTLFSPALSVEQVKQDLAELLSPTRDARVFWAAAKDAQGWRLEQSKNRRELVLALQNSGAANLKNYLDSAIPWARQVGFPRMEKAAGDERQNLEATVPDLLLLDALGAEGLHTVLQGDPVVLPVRKIMAEPYGNLLRDWIGKRFQFAQGAAGAPDGFENYSFVYMGSFHPSDAQGSRITMSIVMPDGFVPARMTFNQIPHVLPGPKSLKARLSRLDDPVPGEPAEGRRVSFCLTPAPDAKPGVTVNRNLDQLLQVISHETGMTLVADGYLRAPQVLPANYQLQNCRVDRLLYHVAQAFRCELRLAPGKPETALIRATDWWLEDRGDVPDRQLEALRKRFVPGVEPKLEDFIAAAQLTEAQGEKLRDISLVPGLPDLDSRGFHDNANARNILKFLGQLPAEQREAAQSPAGLSLSRVDPALARRYLERTLVIGGGISEEIRRRVVFYVKAGTAGPPAHGLGTTRNWTFESKDPHGGTDYGVNFDVLTLPVGTSAP